MQKKQYLTNCVNSTAQKINDMVDRAREITFETFARNCEWRSWAESIGYGPWLYLKNDYHVSFYRSVYEGKKCYYICHSCIEYIFV